MVPITKIVVMMLTSFLLIVATTLAATDDPRLKQERAKRVSKGGRVQTKQIKLYPVKQYQGEIASVVVRGASGHGQIISLRLHFQFNAQSMIEKGQAGTWRVVVKQQEGEKSWSFASGSDLDAEEFWTPELAGESLDVHVFSDVPNSALKLVIDTSIEYVKSAEEKSIVGPDDTIEILKASDPKYIKWGHAVAKLTFITDDDNEAEWCTGFLVAPDIFMTNEHCPRSRRERQRSIVEFDYDSELAATKIVKLKAELMRNEDLDFALYRLNKPLTDRDFLKLKNDDQNLSNQKPLIVIQHPGGRPKRLASVQCQVKTSATGSIDPISDFGHECDTEGGSSGSPVQDTSGAVVGLHHYGFPSTKGPAEKINQAIKMGEILNFVKSKDESLYKALTN